MSADKYPSIFSRQMEAIVYISYLSLVFSQSVDSFLKELASVKKLELSNLK